MSKAQKLMNSYEYSILFPGVHWDPLNLDRATDIMNWDDSITLRELMKMGGKAVNEMWLVMSDVMH